MIWRKMMELTTTEIVLLIIGFILAVVWGRKY